MLHWEMLVRLHKHCGYAVIVANYYGDQGAHIAKCLWKLQQKIDVEKLDLDKIETNICNKGEWLGNMYTEAHVQSSLKTYTKFPYPGVVVAKIVSITKHSNIVIIGIQTTSTHVSNKRQLFVTELVTMLVILLDMHLLEQSLKNPIEQKRNRWCYVCGRILKLKDVGMDQFEVSLTELLDPDTIFGLITFIPIQNW